MSLTGKHERLLEKLAEFGVDVSVTHTVPGTFDPLTETSSPPTQSVVLGRAVEVPGDPEELVDLEAKHPVTLLFAPITIGETVEELATLQWAGDLRTIRRIFPIRPNGTLIAARLILG